jgi:hypothetical protein
MFELLRYCRLNLTPGQPGGQHRQWIVQIDHGVNSAAEKVHWLHLQIPQKVTLNITFLGGFGAPKLPKKLASMRAGGVLQGRLHKFIRVAVTKFPQYLKSRLGKVVSSPLLLQSGGQRKQTNCHVSLLKSRNMEFYKADLGK